MRRWVLLLLPLLLTACGGGLYKIPKEEYRAKVQTLGVVPLLIDENSTISHPERQKVLNLLRRDNVGKEEGLIKLIREQKGYFDVRKVPGDPRQMFNALVTSSTLRGQGSETFRHYQFNSTEVSSLARDNAVDALLVVVMNGIVRPEKVWDRTRLNYLEANYNSIIVTAAVVLPTGEIAWEYSSPFLPLQYPDFDEAYYNKTDAVKIKYISTQGLARALAEPQESLFGHSKFPRVYGELFDRIASALKPGMLNPFKKPEASPATGATQTP
ncbi:MAG: hypothetical protein P8Z70_00690 [Desulfuromonadales bacterium]